MRVFSTIRAQTNKNAIQNLNNDKNIKNTIRLNVGAIIRDTSLRKLVRINGTQHEIGANPLKQCAIGLYAERELQNKMRIDNTAAHELNYSSPT